MRIDPASAHPGQGSTRCGVYNRLMSAPSNPIRPLAPAPTAASRDTGSSRSASAGDDAVICERCGAEMFRMHAVWRCPACRYKTDCCGW